MIASIFAAIIGIIHVYTFYLESLAWGKPATNKLFKVNAAEAAANKAFAFNQGFYNLFLAIAISLGLILQAREHFVEGTILIDYAAASVFGAGLVLLASGKSRLRPAMIQALPALFYGLFRLLDL